MQPNITCPEEARSLAAAEVRLSCGVRRVLLCGLSNRALSLLVNPILNRASECGSAALVGIVDADLERVESFRKGRGLSVPCAPPDGLGRLLDETDADTLAVTGPDCTHAEYILFGLRRGMTVVSEKPVVTSCADGRRVLAAERRSDGRLLVAHNGRYGNAATRVKQILRSGEIGRPVLVSMDYSVDSYHGPSYFSRWNRTRKMSGGLSIHKCCHHFDLIHWWLEDFPTVVSAHGALNFFGPSSPHRPPGDDLLSQKAACPYYRKWFLGKDGLPDDDHLRGHQGAPSASLPYPRQYPKPIYIYDAEIDVEDTYAAVMRFRHGCMAAYSVVFSGAWEGFNLSITGTHGRLEMRYVAAPQRAPLPESLATQIRVFPLFGEARVEEVSRGEGGHGGADPALRRDLFLGPDETSIRLNRLPRSMDGLRAVAVGEAVWRSAAENRPIPIRELFPELVNERGE